jgi:anti-sigma B factor antagonist
MPGVSYPIEMVKGVPVVAAPAEIDASNADWLGAVLLEAASRGRARFVVDMTGTTFCDSAGLHALVSAHKRALAQGGELRLVISAGSAVLRIFAIAGIDRVIPNFTDLDQALQPAPAAAPRPRRKRRRRKPGMRPGADQPPPGPTAESTPDLRSPGQAPRARPWPGPHRPILRTSHGWPARSPRVAPVTFCLARGP